MGNYRIRGRSGRSVRGGFRPEWRDYFGDERGSLIKFGMPDTPETNETLRRNVCALGHEYSVTTATCPVCAAQAERTHAKAETQRRIAAYVAQKESA